MCLLVILSCALLQEVNMFSLERNPAHRLLFHSIISRQTQSMQMTPTQVPCAWTIPPVPFQRAVCPHVSLCHSHHMHPGYHALGMTFWQAAAQP